MATHENFHVQQIRGTLSEGFASIAVEHYGAGRLHADQVEAIAQPLRQPAPFRTGAVL